MIRAYVMIKVDAGEYFSVEKTIREEIAKLPGINARALNRDTHMPRDLTAQFPS